MRISEEKWSEIRAAVAAGDRELFERLVVEIIRASDPLSRATSVVEIQGRKFYGFD